MSKLDIHLRSHISTIAQKISKQFEISLEDSFIAISDVSDTLHRELKEEKEEEK